MIDSTLATSEFLHQRNGEMSPIFVGIEGHVSPDVQRSRRAAEMDILDDATIARYTKSLGKMLDFDRPRLPRQLALVAGTHEVTGFTLQYELAPYVKAASACAGIAGRDVERCVILQGDGRFGKHHSRQARLNDLCRRRPDSQHRRRPKVTTVIKRDFADYSAEIHTERRQTVFEACAGLGHVSHATRQNPSFRPAMPRSEFESLMFRAKYRLLKTVGENSVNENA